MGRGSKQPSLSTKFSALGVLPSGASTEGCVESMPSVGSDMRTALSERFGSCSGSP